MRPLHGVSFICQEASLACLTESRYLKLTLFIFSHHWESEHLWEIRKSRHQGLMTSRLVSVELLFKIFRGSFVFFVDFLAFKACRFWGYSTFIGWWWWAELSSSAIYFSFGMRLIYEFRKMFGIWLNYLLSCGICESDLACAIHLLRKNPFLKVFGGLLIRLSEVNCFELLLRCSTGFVSWEVGNGFIAVNGLGRLAAEDR
jgi:hypothetical protein